MIRSGGRIDRTTSVMEELFKRMLRAHDRMIRTQTDRCISIYVVKHRKTHKGTVEATATKH